MTATTEATEAQTPALAKRRLGARLRHWRIQARKTQPDAALALGCHETKVRRIETGRTCARPGDVMALAFAYGIPDDQRDQLLALSHEARRPGLTDDYRDVVSDELSFLGELEGVADQLDYWDPDLVPGIVQTPEYAAAVVATAGLPADVSRRRVEFRLQRQRAVWSRDVRVRIVVGEGALLYRVGGGDVMAVQRRHLVDLSERGFDVRVRPFAAGLHQWMPGGAFTILGFPDRADPAVVYMESHTDSRYMETKRELVEHRGIFDQLSRSAVPAREFL